MKTRGDRLLNLAILALAGVLAAACAWRWWPRRRDVSRPVRVEGERPLIYRQRDPRWRDVPIGGSGESLGEVGCTVCCIAMALDHHGIAMTPGELNAKLKAHDGYTERGWVKWDAVSTVTGGAVRVQVPRTPSAQRIDSALAAGHLVIAKVLIWRVTQHWVLIVAKDGDDYAIKDPLGEGRSLEKLSKYRSGVEAIRIVKKAAGP